VTGRVALAAEGFELVVLAMPERIAATIAIADPPERRANNPVTLVFDVPDIAIRQPCPGVDHG
jgi:hypothetical protein